LPVNGAIAPFSTVMAVAAFLDGIKHVGPSQGSILSTLEPVITLSRRSGSFARFSRVAKPYRNRPPPARVAELYPCKDVIIDLRLKETSMDVQNQRSDELQKVAELVEEIKIAMLTTEEDDGSLCSRPMSTAQMDSNGDLWFFTSLSSAKVEECEHHRQVNLSYVHIEKQHFLSISGAAQVVRDKEKMKQLWTPWLQPWFPQGVDDPELVLLKVSITHAEYWDSPGSTARRLYGLAKAIVTGNTEALGEHRKVQL
jgi:general stress protein 26